MTTIVDHTAVYCHSCGDGIPIDALCYRIAGSVYCSRCISEAACFAEEEQSDGDVYDGFAANWEVTEIRQRGRFMEQTVRVKAGDTQRDGAEHARKGVR